MTSGVCLLNKDLIKAVFAPLFHNAQNVSCQWLLQSHDLFMKVLWWVFKCSKFITQIFHTTKTVAASSDNTLGFVHLVVASAAAAVAELNCWVTSVWGAKFLAMTSVHWRLPVKCFMILTMFTELLYVLNSLRSERSCQDIAVCLFGGLWLAS